MSCLVERGIRVRDVGGGLVDLHTALLVRTIAILAPRTSGPLEISKSAFEKTISRRIAYH